MEQAPLVIRLDQRRENDQLCCMGQVRSLNHLWQYLKEAHVVLYRSPEIHPPK